VLNFPQEADVSKTFTLEIPEAEARSFEAVLDEALAALRKLDDQEAQARKERIRRLKGETRAMLDQIGKMLNVEKTL
jgi:hypothetical protein